MCFFWFADSLGSASFFCNPEIRKALDCAAFPSKTGCNILVRYQTNENNAQ